MLLGEEIFWLTQDYDKNYSAFATHGDWDNCRG